MNPIKIAMMSLTHAHSRKYFNTLQSNANMQWVAACAEAKEIKELFLSNNPNIPCYTSEAEMFDNHPDIEAVVMASSNNKHLQQFRECATRGVHVLCMKIPTFDMSEYEEIIQIVKSNHIICQVELELHYNPVTERLKRIIKAGKLGEVIGFNGTNITLSPVWSFPWQGVPEDSYGKRVAIKSGDNRFRGGCLCDHPHLFDLIRTITNSEFEYIYAEVGPNLRPGIIVEDNMLIIGKMKNGITFLFDPSWSRSEERLKIPGPGWENYPKRMEVNLTISGENGILLADCFGPNVYHNGAPNYRYTVQYTYFDEWIGLMDDFVNNIRNKTEPKSSLAWHQKTIEAMNACYDSVAAEEYIFLKDVFKLYYKHEIISE